MMKTSKTRFFLLVDIQDFFSDLGSGGGGGGGTKKSSENVFRAFFLLSLEKTVKLVR